MGGMDRRLIGNGGYGDKGFKLMGGVECNWGEGIFENGFREEESVGVSGGREKVKYYMWGN